MGRLNEHEGVAVVTAKKGEKIKQNSEWEKMQQNEDGL